MKFYSRQTSRPSSPKLGTIKPRLERLEERQLLSGFGTQDGGYIVEPWLGEYSDVQIQPGDQKIVAAGDASSGLAVARYDSGGNADTTYGSGGPSIPPLSGVSSPSLGLSNGTGLVLQNDGKAVVSGYTTTNSSFAVARFNSNGALDSGFGSGGWASLDARAGDFNPTFGIGLQSTGKVVVAGTSQSTQASTTYAEVARFTAGGVIDSGKGAFGQAVQGKASGYTLNVFGMTVNFFHDLAVQPDDKLVTVGVASGGGNNARLIVARYTASGQLDNTFNGNGYSAFLPAGISVASGWGVGLQSNGKIVVTGSCTGTDGANDMLVARYNTNGTLDTSFGGGSGYVRLDDGAATQSQEVGYDVAIQPDGKIVVGGQTSVSGNPSKVLVARFNVDGTPDATFAPGGFKIGAPLPNSGCHSFTGTGVTLQLDGSIIVAGFDDWDSTDANENHPFLMRFLPTTASPLIVAQAQSVQTETAARSVATGADVSVLGSLNLPIANSPDAPLDTAAGHTITLDPNAAGWNWSIGRSWGRRRVPQAGRVDLLSALTTK